MQSEYARCYGIGDMKQNGLVAQSIRKDEMEASEKT
jgi:hypothetical protein